MTDYNDDPLDPRWRKPEAKRRWYNGHSGRMLAAAFAALLVVAFIVLTDSTVGVGAIK